MSCCIYIGNCLKCPVVNVCPSQMGGNPNTNYCPQLATLEQQYSPGASCVCPNLVKPSSDIYTGIFSNPGAQKIANAGKNAGRAVNDALTSFWNQLKLDFAKLPSITTILVVLLVALLMIVFVYGYARSR